MSRSPRVLIAFYSHSTHTLEQGTALADRLGAEVERIVPAQRFRWPFGLWRAGRMAFLGETQSLAPSRHDPKDFDFVVVGTPVWAWHATPPVRSWLEQHRDRLPPLAFFATYGGVEAARVAGDIAEASGQKPVAHALISHQDEARSRDREKIERLAVEVERVASSIGAATGG